MFLSKIWLVFVSVALAITIALSIALPRMAKRQQHSAGKNQLRIACNVVQTWFRADAQKRVLMAGQLARANKIIDIMGPVQRKRPISSDRNRSARSELSNINKDGLVDFIILLDKDGRVVARLGIDDNEFGDSMAGVFLVDDALRGQQRDDIWVLNSKFYLTSAAPIVERLGNYRYLGAVVLGKHIDTSFARSLVKGLQVEANFFASGASLVSTTAADSAESAFLRSYDNIRHADHDITDDCSLGDFVEHRTQKETTMGLAARLPGEAKHLDAFYSLSLSRPNQSPIASVMGGLTQEDFSWGTIPSALYFLGILLTLLFGFFLLRRESEKPMRELLDDAIELIKEPTKSRLKEKHRGTFGSLARSINIYLDKIKMGNSEASATGLDPFIHSRSPSGSYSGLRPISPGSNPSEPVSRPISQAAAPAPVPSFAPPLSSEPMQSTPSVRLPSYSKNKNPAIPAVPYEQSGKNISPESPMSGPSALSTPLPHTPSASEPKPSLSVSDYDLGIPPLAKTPSPPKVPKPPAIRMATQTSPQLTMREIFTQFIDMKQRFDESTSGITFEIFAKKLEKNRTALMKKHDCTDVQFTVYEKNGRAALRATPIK